jgi:hypothetical protein
MVRDMIEIDGVVILLIQITCQTGEKAIEYYSMFSDRNQLFAISLTDYNLFLNFEILQ